MKLIVVIGLLTITATSIAVGQAKNTRTATSDKAEQEIRQVEDKRREALLRSDTAALDQILADEHFVTNQFGQIQTKAQMISALKSGEAQVRIGRRGRCECTCLWRRGCGDRP